ncbi:MAG TPA: glycosyltransferase family 2 protein, partial [Bacilli bacterium]|nr:glycosyltransferase family 2 protein [Bacilli bacterium]
MEKVKIAVIVPVYKAEKFLERCLDSILNQTLKEIKVICVDNASPDNCGAILKKYAAEDDRIVVITHKENMGPSVSRNDGLDYVYNNIPEAEYIAFVDADDKIEPDTYETVYNEGIKSQADIVNFNFLPSTYWSYKTVPTTEPVDYKGNCLRAIFDNEQFYTFVVCW